MGRVCGQVELPFFVVQTAPKLFAFYSEECQLVFFRDLSFFPYLFSVVSVVGTECCECWFFSVVSAGSKGQGAAREVPLLADDAKFVQCSFSSKFLQSDC